MSARLFAIAALVSLSLAGCKKDAPAEGAAPSDLTASAGKGVQFTAKAPAVGTTYDDVSRMQMELSMKVGGLPAPESMRNIDTSRFRVAVLEVDGDSVTKAKLVYAEKATTEGTGAEPGKSETSIVQGKSYIVSLGPDGPLIKTPDGKAAPEDEAVLVRDDCDVLGPPDEFRAAISGRSIKPGEDVPDVTRALKKLLNEGAAEGSGSTPRISGVKAKLTEDKGEFAVFSVTATMKMEDDGINTSINLIGTLDVRKRDAQLIALRLGGPVTVATAQGSGPKEADVSGTGKMSIEILQLDVAPPAK